MKDKLKSFFPVVSKKNSLLVQDDQKKKSDQCLISLSLNIGMELPATVNRNKIFSETDVFNSVKKDLINYFKIIKNVARTMHYLGQDQVFERRCPRSGKVRTKLGCKMVFA